MKKDFFIDIHIENYIDLLLKNKNYKSIYKSLIVDKNLLNSYHNVYVNPIYQKKILNLLLDDVSFKSLFKSKKTLPSNDLNNILQYHFYKLFSSVNIMNNNNYLLSKEELLYFSAKRYNKSFGIIKYTNISLFWSFLFISKNKNLVFKYKNEIYYFNRKKFLEVKSIVN